MFHIKSAFYCKKSSVKKSAFSLIELSIVLVIIGLLIAGVTGGISLLRGATLRAVMSESRAFGTAVNSFNAQYDTLPGDYKTAIGGSGDGSGNQGNGNGVIEFINGSSPQVAEGLIAWQHLQNASMIDVTFTPTTASVSISGTLPAPVISTAISATIPASKVKGGGWLFDKIGSTDSFVIVTGAMNSAGTTPSGVTAATVTGVISAVDALAIDTKIDDGKANLGRVQANGLTGVSSCTSSATYQTGTAGLICALGFQVSQ